jgi:hypothetical protein
LLLESGGIMTELQETKRFNKAEIMLPHESMKMPAITSESPMDLPVERFTKALARREENRKALPYSCIKKCNYYK